MELAAQLAELLKGGLETDGPLAQDSSADGSEYIIEGLIASAEKAIRENVRTSRLPRGGGLDGLSPSLGNAPLCEYRWQKLGHFWALAAAVGGIASSEREHGGKRGR